MPEPMWSDQDVFAARLHVLRMDAGLSQGDLARRARELGLNWTQSTVAAIETRRRDVTLGEALLLQILLGRPLNDFLDHADNVVVEGVPMWGPQLHKLAAGEPPPSIELEQAARIVLGSKAVPEKVEADRAAIEDLARRYGVRPTPINVVRIWAAATADAEVKAARQLDVDPLELAAAAFAAWGQSLSDEREHRLNAEQRPGDPRARKGHVTRQLVDELEGKVRSQGMRRRKR